MKLNSQILDEIVDGISMLLIGLFCFFYSVFAADFAEICINLKFLKFPIFIGELLLIACILLLLLKFKLSPVKMNGWLWLLACWIIFILIKAFCGYKFYGALAFRNAALFYYSIFAIITYYLFNFSLIKRKWRFYLVLTSVLICTLLRIPLPYYIYTYIISGLVLLLNIQNKHLRHGLIALFIFFLPYKLLFGVCRGALLAHLTAWLFLFIVFLLMFKFRLKYKVYLASLFLFLALVFIYLFADPNNIKSLLTPGVVLAKYNAYKNQYYETMDKLGYLEKNMPILLYEGKFSKEQAIVKPVKKPVSKKQLDNAIIQQPKLQAYNIEIPKTEVTNIPNQEKEYRSLNTAYSNIVWRMIVYSDMWEEIFTQKLILGADFGKPFRSKTIETLKWNNAGQWVGWIEPHNSYIHILYRTSFVGALFIINLISLLIWLAKNFIKLRDLKGILLCSALIYWLIFPNFAVVLELPYFAIPFWCLLGAVSKYANSKIKPDSSNA